MFPSTSEPTFRGVERTGFPEINTTTKSPVYNKTTYLNGDASAPILLRSTKLSVHGYKSPRSKTYPISRPPNVNTVKYESPTHYDMPSALNKTVVHDKTAGATSKRLLKWSQKNAQNMWDRKQDTYQRKYSTLINHDGLSDPERATNSRQWQCCCRCCSCQR